MLEDLGNPTAQQLARALGVTTRTVQRWHALGEAPRPAMLALFWLTRWGRSQVHCDAVNDAAVQAGLAKALQRQVDELRRQVEHLRRIGDFGAANDPASSYRPPPVPTPDPPGATAAATLVPPENLAEPTKETMPITQNNRTRCRRIRNVEEPARKVRAKRWQTSCGFRLIRVYTADHNAGLWVTHIARKRREWVRAPGGKRFALRARRLKLTEGRSA
ncbi:hypothetical protein [Ideonella sp.]|uniref:hypothetical protein n=1 Tax=Ideonella sp. TaxID=1929293 RepID=UPI0035B48629